LWLIVQNYIFEMFLLLPSIFGGALISWSLFSYLIKKS
jgi:hypothetical protein